MIPFAVKNDKWLKKGVNHKFTASNCILHFKVKVPVNTKRALACQATLDMCSLKSQPYKDSGCVTGRSGGHSQ